VDGGQSSTFDLQPETTRVPIAQRLAEGRHTVEINADGTVAIDGFIIRNAPNTALWLAVVMVALLAGAWWAARPHPLPPLPLGEGPHGRDSDREHTR
jgi:hypothetical protein